MGASGSLRKLATMGLAIGLAAAGPAPPPVSTSNPPPPHRNGAETLAASQDRSARLTISVMVNGRGPYPFVVDTAANRSVISRELAITLKLPVGPRVSLDDALGKGDVDTVLIDRLDFGSRAIKGIDAPVLAAANLGADGMLGIDSLRNQHVVMDFVGKKFLVSPAAEEIDDFSTTATVVHGRRRSGQLVLVDAESQAVPIFVILDSGAQNTIGNAALRRLMTYGTRRGAKRPTDRLISVTGSQTMAELDEMPEIKLGGVTIRNAPVAYANLHTFTQFGLDERPALLLGMDVLHFFRSVTIDFRRREAAFVIY